MDRFFRRRRNVVITIICVLAIVLVLIFSLTKDTTEPRTPIGGFLRNVFSPVNKFFTSVGNKVSSWGSFVFSLGDVKRENEALTHQVDSFEGMLTKLTELQDENARLTELLNLKSIYSGDTLAARIIYRDVTSWLGNFTIDKGYDDGVEEGMAIISVKGLVGRVVSVTKDTAVVINIVDPRNSVGAINARTRDPLVVEGTGNEQATCRAFPFSFDVEFEIGDAIISSGIGGIYPKGHLIGYVVEVVSGKYGVLNDAIVEPEVDFVRLEEVLVLLENQSGAF